MQRTTVKLAVITAAVVALAAPANAGGSFSVHIGTPGFGLSFSSHTWAPYGQAWSDPSWSVNFGVAFDGYGEWVHVGGLGRVWRPWVAPGWRPYTHGRWVWTSVGWTWVAYEPWGWIPHHFGHWAYAPAGWVWVPGTTWHPGNVTWVSHGGWVGWYPCPPRGWSHANRGWHGGYERGYVHGYDRGYGHGYADGWRDARYATWVEWKHLGTADDVSRHAITHARAARLAAPGAVQVLDSGPSRVAVERRGGQPVAEASLERRTLKVDGRTVSVARPTGTAVDQSLRRSAPRTVETALAPDVRSRVRSVSSSGAVTRSAPKERAPASPQRRPVASPELRRSAQAPRSGDLVIDDRAVRSVRPPVTQRRTEAPASGSWAARGSSRVVRAPASGIERPTIRTAPRPLPGDRSVSRPALERPQVRVAPRERPAPTARRVTPPTRPLQAPRAVTRSASPAPRVAPRAQAPTRSPASREIVAPKRTTRPASPSVRTAQPAPRATARSSERTTTQRKNRRSN
jgi:hypothetical protein